MEYLADIEKPNNTFAIRYCSQLKKTSTLLLLTMLTACGGGGSGGGDESSGDLTVSPIPDVTGTFRYLGQIDIFDDTFENKVYGYASFFEFVDLQNASALGSSVPMVEDSCSARVSDSFPINPGTIGFPEVPFHLVGAGETFTLTSLGSTYATVVLSNSRLDVGMGSAPDDLTLDLSGGTFPAFSSLTVPTIPMVTNFKPTRNQNVTVDTVFTWDRDDANTGSIYMTLVDFVDLAVEPLSLTKYIEINCRMANDGSFELPQAVKNILNEGLGNGFILTGAQRDEQVINIVTQGDAALIVTRRIARF